MDFSNVVMSNVYLDNVDDFNEMNGVYAEYFKGTPPARTTVQQTAPGPRTTDQKGRYPTLEQISIIAVK
jgi:enamine deaminase RidA (YjgF/YER057c/UK114 family)